MMHRPRRLAIAVLFASAILTESCNDGLLHSPAPAAALVSMTASMSRFSGGSQEAFDRADRLFVRFRAGDVVRLEQEVPFVSTGAATTVRVQVPLRELSEAMTAELELRLGNRALFRGVTSSTLSSGTPTPMEFALNPVVAAVVCGTGLVQLNAYGETAQLAGAALFATGDTVRGLPVAWSVATNTAASVSETGAVTALQDGDAVATCAASGVTATRQLRVLAAVSAVQVAPGTATLVVGTSLTYAATLLDARGNVITTSRPLVWSSSSSALATVGSTTGVVTGVSSGAARIDATSGAVVGSATLAVVVPSTAVTNASTGVTGSAATLRGSVNPRGLSTQAWFEWGTDPALAAPASTTVQSVGGGTVDVSIAQALTTLVPNATYYFRVVASSNAGTVRGTTLSFRTPPLPTAVTAGLDSRFPDGFVMNGSATPNGNATVAWFEYGTSPTLATSTPTTRQSIGSGVAPVTILQGLSLQQYTTYYVRTTASNIGGTANGNIISFSTGGSPDLLSSGRSTTIGCTGVDVFGTGRPNGTYTRAWFEYSFSSSMTNAVTIGATVLGSGSAGVPFTSRINYSNGSTIYFRAVVSNVFGRDQTTTPFTVSAPICVN
ncbi:MAG: Ig-like domain-containing protein [Gemmatimonadaceae bacterium]